MTASSVELGEFVDVVMGQAPPGSACNKEGTGTVFVKAGEFEERTPAIREWTTQPLKMAAPKDTLVCVVGATAGKVNYSAFDCAIGRSVAAVRPQPERLDSLFLYYFLRTKVEQLRDRSQGAAQGVITREMLQCLRLVVPPLPEQRRIAAILDKADALRTKRREVLVQLDRLAQSIFVEMFGVYEKGCSQWPTKTLGELASDMKIGLVRSSEEFGEQFKVPYVRMNAIGRRGEFIDELVQRTDVTDDELEEYRLQVGDILFNTRNSKELVGKTAIFREAGDYVYNNNLMRIRFDQRIDPEYAAQSFLTPLLQQELEFRKSGTTSVFAIYARDLNTVPIPVPPIELQRAFAMQMSTLRRARLKMSVQEANANSLFVSLQHRAFRGEL